MRLEVERNGRSETEKNRGGKVEGYGKKDFDLLASLLLGELGRA